ncbi:expressed unknown protein [Seminavis robusta]|uniref:DEX1 C-terminal domain-containing protein n=1 Tax=Seminavis robusta TaxID=568900 RepID=A0A9N8H858_9STRA|nr:expressed unknown protein [Seminavis robusta]|eukprot:Sro83_g044510.1 n/a (1243) ;mRNA; f:103970-107921
MAKAAGFFSATCLIGWLSLLLPTGYNAEPQSKPYIPFRTDPTEHSFVKHVISWDDNRSDRKRSNVRNFDAIANEAAGKSQCPLHFTLGVSRRAHHKAQNSNAFSVVRPAVVHPVFPARGPGRQIIHTTLYEHLDLLSPEIASGPESASSTIIKEGLIQHQEFPLLFESSSFAYSSPIVHDVNGDAIPDAILSDYDGGIYIVGLHQGKDGKRWFHKAQVPRIFIRKTWVEARVNETWKKLHPEEPEPEKEQEGEGDEHGSRDPYHSYFEYSSGHNHGQKDVLRGVTANVLGQKPEDLNGLKNRRSKKPGPVNTDRGSGEEEEHEKEKNEEGETNHEAVNRRRLQEVDILDEMDASFPRRRLQEVNQEEENRRRQEEENRRREEENKRHREEEENKRRREEEEHRKRQEEENRRHEEENRRKQEEENKRRREEEENRKRQEEENRRHEEENRRKQEEENKRREEDNRRKQEEENRHREEEANRKRQEEENKHREEEENRKRQEEESRHREEEENRKRQEEDNRRREEEENRKRQEEAQQREHEVQQEPERRGEEHHVAERGDSAPEERTEQTEEGGPDEEAEENEEVEGEGEGDDDESESASEAGPYDDAYRSESNSYGDDREPPSDYGYGGGDDMYGAAGGYDDYYGRYQNYRDDYYDEKHYVRINPHILATPTLAELPKLYGSDDEVEDILFVPVSYYLDEDEYEGHLSYRRFENTDAGDETEVQRGMYIASAIMLFQLNGGDPRWGRQEHLDLSTDHSSPQNATLLGKIPVSEDHTHMGAFALSKPAVGDIDGDGKLDVLIGTSMGIVYAFDATHMTLKNNWPIQMPAAVESPIVLEDVAANTKLETIVADIGGNVAVFDEDANKVWHRDLRAAASDGPSVVRASSPMSLGDINGDGILDIVLSLQILHEQSNKEITVVFAMHGSTGRDLDNFPIAFDTPPPQRSKPMEDWVHEQLPGLLLVDLHGDQSHVKDYIRRNGTKWEKSNRKASPGGGTAAGLHLVFPVGETLYIIEGGSGCTQTFGVGEEMVSMVQVDDVHGTNSLDLVVSTTSGNIITMESSAPYHPLNVWNNGDTRGRLSGPVHGFSASQGIFVHGVSREYRDIFGVFVPVTLEIFDNRPDIHNEPDKRVYKVEIRDGTSYKRTIWRNTYNQTGVFTERLYIPHGAGYYALLVQMRGSNGLVYEDMFHVGYNVNYMDGFGILLWFPLLLAAVAIFLGSSRNVRWDDDDYENGNRGGGLGILG